jgi:lysophospholipid acyltransferase (LPLAT)-like uncharacterized protein
MEKQTNYTYDELVGPVIKALRKLEKTYSSKEIDELTKGMNEELSFQVIISVKNKKSDRSSLSKTIKVRNNGKSLLVTTDIPASTTSEKAKGLTARSAVDVLTNNELAETIADLKAAIKKFE